MPEWWKMKQPSYSKKDILEMIMNAGLWEDFIKWMQGKKIISASEPLNPEDLSLETLREYADERNLLDDGEISASLGAGDDVEAKIEPLEVRPRTPPRKT